ncbi:MAG: HEAT repeat domain-containing protein [Planctomycetales bacterium]|nr:HEAT repeat domain-containing protein [Planctomycetales bacterium]
MPTSVTRKSVVISLLAACVWVCPKINGAPGLCFSQEAQWIWSPEHPRGQAKQGDCFFRKTLELTNVEQATITITADDEYSLFVNGRQAGVGRSIKQMEHYDITRLLRHGRNVIAVRVNNLADGPAALAARVFIKPPGKPWASYSTDDSWRSHLDSAAGWQAIAHDDSRWKPSQMFGALGETAPWDRREEVAPQRLSENQRFRISNEFAVDQVMGNDETGSLVNMAFNEFGHIIAAREGGPLLLIYDSDKDGKIDKTRDYCDLVANIQGILPLNGDVFVTGEGPEGLGVYRLVDKDRNGELEEARKVVGFRGEAGEHGAHGLTLGPDGRIYCVLGNQAYFDGEFADTSPLKTFYEGDLVPRYEDPGGHAQGIKAPGGTVIRFDVEGQTVELVAGGLRNSYDLLFGPNGRLFVHDSDMESDEGAPWYRPTSLYEVVEGSEFGWRSGWAKWPIYYFDRLPPVLETGRGSPTGACLYDHFMFPQRFHGRLMLADWTQGQILSVKLDAAGQAQSEVFLQGQPLNVTDLAVGPDGWLYFCTGGRGTKGGIYQVRWLGKVPDTISDLGEGIAAAVKQPQLDSAWARQKIASIKRELGTAWADTVAGVAFSDENPAKYRVRALELMQLFGPTPTPELLTALSESPNEAVRATSAHLMALHGELPEMVQLLEKLLSDSDLAVQHAACEALLRSGAQTDYEFLVPLLESTDRQISWAARRILERLPSQRWKEPLLAHENIRVRLQACLALMIGAPSDENARQVLEISRETLKGFVSDRDFMDLLRMTQVALHRSSLPREQLDELAKALAGEFPVGEPILNRELFRLLAYLNCEKIIPNAISYLQSDAELPERVHVGMHLRFFEHPWSSAERYAIIKFFEESLPADTGSSVPLYVLNVTRDLCQDLPLEEARLFVSEGAKWPNAALVSLYQYPETLSSADLQTLKRLDQEIDRPGFEAEQYKRLRTGIVAMLSQHGDEDAMEYLRQIWVRNPERRQAVALGLAQSPGDENWDYLIRSLPVLESYAVTEVLNALRTVPQATDDPQALREVIIRGLKIEQENMSPRAATALLSYWTGQKLEADEGESELAPWQAWYAGEFPNRPEAKLPELEQASPWTMDTLFEYFLSSDGRKGNGERGKLVYAKAQCASCHRMGNDGTAIGPDLSTVANRFTRNEVIESILFPSHVISDQYRSQTVLTSEGKIFTGIISKTPSGALLVRDSQLQEHLVAEQDVDEMKPSKTSMMPSGLLDNLTAAEIRDLMTFLGFVPDERQQVANVKELHLKR